MIMRIVKYDASISSSGSSSSISSSGSGTSTNVSGGSVDLDRTIWGKNDTGDDIDGHMTVNGDINIYAISNNYAPDDEDVDGEDVEVDEGGGNLNVELDVTVGRHLYVNHSHDGHTGSKVCLIGEVENNAKQIETNKTDITNLKTTVNNHTTEISNLKTTVDGQTTMIDSLDINMQMAEESIRNNAEEIAKLKNSSLSNGDLPEILSKDDILKLIQDNLPVISDMGSHSQPVILWSGRCRKVSYKNDSYYMEGIQIPYFTLDNKIEKGLMTITITPVEGYKVNVYAVHATQEHSGDTADLTNTRLVQRNEGAHWFECRVDSIDTTNLVYVREFHQGNGDNDTWYSDNFMETDASVQAINLTLVGYVWKQS